MAGEKGNTNAAGLLQAIFQATFTDLSTLLANSASPATVLYVSLHTADPTAAGTQLSSEVAYTNYGRVSVARTSAGWTLTNETITNAAAINFPACGATGATAAYFGVGLASSGAGTLIYAGPLSSSLAISNGVTPSFAIGQLSVVEA